MRHLATFLSVVALILAVGMMFRLRVYGVLWAPALYLIAQTLFALIAWWGIQTHSLESKSYATAFGWMFAFVLLTSTVTSVLIAARLFPPAYAVWLLISAGGLSGFVVYAVFRRLALFYITVPGQLVIAVVQGGIVFYCGVVMLACLFAPMKPELHRIATALGGFWFCIGLFMLLWAIGVTRDLQVWLTLNNFLPSLIAIAAFGWLTWQLAKLQSERVFEPIPVSHEISLEVSRG